MSTNHTAADIADLTRTGKVFGCRVRVAKAQMLRKALRLQRTADDYATRGQLDIADELAQSSRDLLVRASNVTLPALPSR